MIIQGILDNSLNGQLCIRGFANIKDLAKFSEADYSYQRPLLDRTDISDFLETQEYLFFPEVILSYKFKHQFAPQKDTPLIAIQNGKNYKSAINGDSISVKVLADKKDLSAKAIRVVKLIVNDINGKPFHRIDGNHRLNAAETSESEKVERMVIPFCLLLGTEYFDSNVMVDNEETKNFDKAIKVFFYNINTKTIPLTSEQNLKVLIDDNENFPDEELENIFGGRQAILTRQLMNKIDPIVLFQGFKHVIKDNYRTYFNDIFSRLLVNEISESDAIEKTINSLQAVNQLYNENACLKANDSFGLLTAFLWYHINGIDKYNAFKNWILSNHIFEIKEVTAGSIIKIFDKLISQKIDVFVAMPYFDGKPEIIEDYNKIYREVIDNIASTYKINISVYPIMCNKGATSDQIQDIINKIKQAEIIFADITDNNANVLYEMGWARALDKKVVVVKRKNCMPVKSDIQNDTYHEYDDACRSVSLSKIIRDNIIEILKNNYGIISE
jgi:hypothetical protein